MFRGPCKFVNKSADFGSAMSASNMVPVCPSAGGFVYGTAGKPSGLYVAPSLGDGGGFPLSAAEE